MNNILKYTVVVLCCLVAIEIAVSIQHECPDCEGSILSIGKVYPQADLFNSGGRPTSEGFVKVTYSGYEDAELYIDGNVFIHPSEIRAYRDGKILFMGGWITVEQTAKEIDSLIKLSKK